MDASLSELLSLVDSGDEDSMGWIRLDRTEMQDDTVVLFLTVKADQPEIGTTRWQVRAQNIVGYRFEGDKGYFAQAGIELSSNDPILQDYTDTYFTLGFLGKPRDATALCLTLMHVVHDTAPYRDNTRAVKTDPTFYAAGHGFAGRGPEYLMRACFPIMEAEGMEPYLTRGYNPYAKRVTEATQDGPLRLLTINDSFIVASRFAAERGETLPPDSDSDE